MYVWDDNIKMDIKGTNVVFRLNSSLEHAEERDFWRS